MRKRKGVKKKNWEKLCQQKRKKANETSII